MGNQDVVPAFPAVDPNSPTPTIRKDGTVEGQVSFTQARQAEMEKAKAAVAGNPGVPVTQTVETVLSQEPSGPPAEPSATPQVTIELGEDAGPEDAELAKTLEQKYLSGTLTEDEKRLLGLPVEPAKTPEVFVINHEPWSYEKARDAMRKEFGLSDDVSLDPEAESRMVKTWVRAQNRAAQNIAQDRRSEELSESRKYLQRERTRLESKRKELDARKAVLQSQISELESTVKELEAESAKEAKEEELRDESGNLNMNRFTEHVAAVQAKKALARLQPKLMALRAEGTELVNQYESANAEIAKAMIRELQEAHSQYSTAIPLWEVAAAIRQGLPVSDADKAKVWDILNIVNTSLNTGFSLDEVYSRLAETNGLAVKPVPSSRGTTQTTSQPISRRSAVEELRKKIQANRQAALPGLGGPGSRPSPEPPMTPAQILHQRGKEAAFGGGSDAISQWEKDVGRSS